VATAGPTSGLMFKIRPAGAEVRSFCLASGVLSIQTINPDSRHIFSMFFVI
jgi:hypothetical protein